MKRITNFEWNDLVLYSKGWYENDTNTEDEFFDRIETIIKMNTNRSYESKMHRSDIMHMLFNAHGQIISHLSDKEKDCPFWCATPAYFYDAVSNWMRRADWYYNEKISLDYASARVILDVMSNMTTEQIEMRKPIYGKGRLRMGTMFGEQRPISLTYTQMNREAEKVFGKK